MPQANEAVLARKIGLCIKEARRSSGLSREQVARSAGLTGRELSRYEHGKSVPCTRDLQALAGACGMEPSEMIPAELAKSLTEVAPNDTVIKDFLGNNN